MTNFFLVLSLSVLCGMGVGSGGFYLLYLTDTLGIPQYEAQGANLLFFLFASLASSLFNLRAGRLKTPALPPLLLSGVAGVILGNLLTGVLPPAYARGGFGLLLLLGGLCALFGLRAKKARKF